MFAYFIIYEQDGKTGNDFVKGNIPPYKWLIEVQGKYPKSRIAIKSFERIAIPEHEFTFYNDRIGIDQDNQRNADNKAVRKPVKAQAKEDNGNASKPRKVSNRKHNNTNK